MDKESQQLMTRGELVRQARIRLGLSQTELGKIWAGIVNRTLQGNIVPYSQAWISDFERGRYDVERTEISRLAQILGISESLLAELPVGNLVSRRIRGRRKRKGQSTPVHLYGASDVVNVVELEEPGLEFHFSSARGRYSRSLRLTRYPLSFGEAIERALFNHQGIFEYQGENFSGRVLSHGYWSHPFTLVAEFSLPQMAGFLIHTGRQQVEALRAMLLQLPLHILPTD